MCERGVGWIALTRNSTAAMEDFPAPVRPTMPTLSRALTVKLRSRYTGRASLDGYAMHTPENTTSHRVKGHFQKMSPLFAYLFYYPGPRTGL